MKVQDFKFFSNLCVICIFLPINQDEITALSIIACGFELHHGSRNTSMLVTITWMYLSVCSF